MLSMDFLSVKSMPIIRLCSSSWSPHLLSACSCLPVGSQLWQSLISCKAPAFTTHTNLHAHTHNKYLKKKFTKPRNSQSESHFAFQRVFEVPTQMLMSSSFIYLFITFLCFLFYVRDPPLLFSSRPITLLSTVWHSRFPFMLSQSPPSPILWSQRQSFSWQNRVFYKVAGMVSEDRRRRGNQMLNRRGSCLISMPMSVPECRHTQNQNLFYTISVKLFN